MQEYDVIQKAIENNFLDKDAIKTYALHHSVKKKYKKNTNMIKASFSLAAAVIVLLIASLAFVSVSEVSPEQNIEVTPEGFESYQNVIDVIDNYYKVALNDGSIDIDGATYDYSSGIVSDGLSGGEIIKTNGQHIYKLHKNGLYVFSALDGHLNLLTHIEKEKYYPIDIIFAGNKLILIGGANAVYRPFFSPERSSLTDCSYESTEIAVYDMSDTETPVLERQLIIEGYHEAVRLIENEEKLIFAVRYCFAYKNEDNYIPSYFDSSTDGEGKKRFSEDTLFYYKGIPSSNYLIMGSIELNNPGAKPVIKAYLGLNGAVYISESSLYIAAINYASIGSWQTVEFPSKEKKVILPFTRIVKFGFESFQHCSAAFVSGNINDRRSLNEYNGYLRVATATRSPLYSNIFILDGDMNEAGEITNIAPEEYFASINFEGNRATLSTSKIIKSFFEIDLSNPFLPRISGIKDDSVNDYYIQYSREKPYSIRLGTTSYSITVGRMYQTDESGNMYTTGLKVALFDHSSGNAVCIKSIDFQGKYSFGNILFDFEKGIFAFITEKLYYVSNSNPNYMPSNFIEQGLTVFKFDLTKDDDQKLSYQDFLYHLPPGTSFPYGVTLYRDYVNRGIIMGNYIITVGEKIMKSYDIETLQCIDEYQYD